MSGTAVFGLTLAEYAAAVQRRPTQVRDAYAALLGGANGGPVPRLTRCATDGGVVKFCLGVGDDAEPRWETESVLIPMRGYAGTRWYTLCVSSQVGCRFGCRFCETGRMGLRRQLTAAEIVAQYVAAQRVLAAQPLGAGDPARVRNIVFMGMGEPLDNLANVLQALRVLSDPRGVAVPLARVTLSTVGHVHGLRALAERARAPDADRDWRTLRLAISLHAASDVARARLVPAGRAMPLALLRQALLEFPLPRRGRYFVEYVLLAGVNDSLADADGLAQWCRGLPCTVNLIPYNTQRDTRYAAPDEETVRRFLHRLRACGVFAKRRTPHGRDLMSACGQLGTPI